MATPRDDETDGQDPGGGSGDGGGGNGNGRGPREDTPPAPCGAFCGPRSCATLPPSLSPQQAYPPQPQAPVSTEPKRRRLWGLRGLVKMFRRRVRRRADESVSPQPPQPTLRARSTSELAVDIQHSRNSGPYNQGLSVSHDSVFSPDTSTDTHHGHTTPPSLAIATRGVNMAELKAVLRRRRGDDSGSGDDDPGLPRSPPTSPTTLDVLNHGLKSCSRATQSTCSDGSLLSMGSSENDEDSLGIGSHHSSKLSLLEGRHQVVDNEPVAGAVPLSHQAALHKISVRPRRTHAPRSRRATQIAGQMILPATPEVNEEANNRTAATPKPSPSIISTQQEPLIIQQKEDEVRQESAAVTEMYEPEKKDKEEKRDEPLLQRLFGSVRSGRRRSRGSGDESRENSVSPMRRGADQRTSREKRRDSSGSRFPVLGRVSTKTRQESQHPLPPSGKGREQNERPKQDTSPPSPQTPRSASVEGRLESSSPGSQNIFRMSSYEERSSRPMEGVRKAKSFREVPGNQYEIQSRIISSPHMNREDSSDLSYRKTSSAESLDVDTKTSSSRTNSSSGVTDVSASPHRSIDSLTNTSIPGVFIRPQSQTQYKVFKNKHRDHHQLSQQDVHSGQEMNSGPLSLDSSITLQSREPEDMLRKSSSVSHVSYSMDSQKSSIVKQSDHTETSSRRKSMDVKSFGHKTISIEEKSDSKSKDAKKYPGNPTQIEIETPMKQKGPEDGEVPNESLRRRSLKKEPSLKRILSHDVDSAPVPEFMRIQLNRVENKGHSIIYDTDQDKTAKVDTLGVDISNISVEDLNQVNIHDKSNDSSSNLKIEHSHIVIESKPEKIYVKKSNSKVGKSLKREVSPTGSTLERKDNDSGVEGSSPEPTIDRVVLRKPLVSERAPVMERATSVTGPTTPSPPKSDPPELLKVFARRSFKVKDSDKEKFQSIDYSDDEENVEASSEISEVTVISTRAADNILPLSGNSTSSSAITGTHQPSGQGLQKASINSISFNRKSVGNPTLSFCPPPVAIISNSQKGSSSLSQKTTVISSSSSNTVSAITTTTNTVMTNQNIKPSVSPVQISGTRQSNAIPETNIDATPAAVHVPQQCGISSRIINNRIASMNATPSNDNSSGDELEGSSSPVPPPVTPTPKTSRSGSGLVWPPRPNQEEETSSPQFNVQSNITSSLSRRLSSGPSNNVEIESKPQVKSEALQTSQSRRLSSSPSNNIEIESKSQMKSEGIMIVQPNVATTPARRLSSSPSNTIEIESKSPMKSEGNQDPVEVSPLDIGAARRRFMSGGKDRHSVLTPPLQNSPATPTPSPSPPVQIVGNPAASSGKSGQSVTEARNAAPSFTITVRTQASPSEPTNNSDVNTSVDLNTSTHSNPHTSEKGSVAQAADDWRVLVRQRREGRLKQTKTPDSEEILIETRPPVSRNSKVLEMANNFQKLQVA